MQFTRHDRGITSARSIINYLIYKDLTKLQIQIELDAGKAWEDTSTGAGLYEETLALKSKERRRISGPKRGDGKGGKGKACITFGRAKGGVSEDGRTKKEDGRRS